MIVAFRGFPGSLAGKKPTCNAGAAAAAAKSLQSCPTLCNPIDGSPPGSPVPGILQARTLEWVFEIAWLSEEQINLMTSDFKIIARFFRDKRLGVDDIMRDTTKIKHIDEVLKLFSAMTGDSRYVEVMEMGEYKEADTMCEMFDRAVNKGIEAGIKQASAIIKDKEEQIKDKEKQITEQEFIIEELRKQLAIYQKQ